MPSLSRSVILTSKGRVQGTEADCFVKLAEGFLDPAKKYECRLKFFQWQSASAMPPMESMFLAIEGLTPVDTFIDSEAIPNLIACIHTPYWTLASNTAGLHYEPTAHRRRVMFTSSLLRVRLYNGDTWAQIDPFTGAADTTLTSNWTMELEFVPE